MIFTKRTTLALASVGAVMLVGRGARAERTLEAAEAACADMSKKGADEDSRKIVPARPAVLATASVGGIFGTGFRGGLAASDADKESSTAGPGWNARARVDFALLSPLWVAGSLAYASAGEAKSWHIDAVVGFNLRTLGAHSGKLDGDYRSVSTGASATAGYCNYQRADLTLFGGAKTLLFTSNPRPDAPKGAFALQAGIQRYFFNDGGGKGFWSAAALYDPAAKSYGAQGSMFAGITDWIGIGCTAGGLTGGDHKGFWFTADIGTLQQF